MVALTGGELRGTVLTPDQRGLSIVNKVGFDRQLNKDLRVRLTGSMYKTDKAMSDTLYGGDRAGSRYYWVLENTTATETTNAFSGTINPGFKNKVTALQMNPFVKFRGLEVFGVLERAEGRATAEVQSRSFNQYAVDTVYRFFEDEKLFVGARYNRVERQPRWHRQRRRCEPLGARRRLVRDSGLLVKGEYVDQKYFGYPQDNIKNGGRFKGTMLEGVVGVLAHSGHREVHRVCHEPESNGRDRRASCPPVRHAWTVGRRTVRGEDHPDCVRLRGRRP